ncbi:GH32 C-terminal domain-containing protein [Draconibacterium orientale]|uniref:GH32 C-terminal domain-containing protein n=1 Tax=Draconibacterium orientale TaxID=1168034 RepID=UPI0029BFB87F|nr:GH32 C-terminal domain-containing protein [Draconibacterium orientale]
MGSKISTILIGFVLLLIYACTSQNEQIASWSFDESPMEEMAESVQSIKKPLELVPGISGNGLRTDGYSTFFKSKLPNNLSKISAEAWFALETYPTDTAGFFSFEQDADNWIAANINQFGEVMLSVSVEGNTTWQPANISIEKFAWFHLALAIAKDETTLLLNGRKIAGSPTSLSSAYSSLLVGRDSREKKVHIFPINYINGIIDEIKVWNTALTEDDFNQKNISEFSENKPDLSIPEIRFEGDFHRPKYHLLPAANWTNETHGLIYYNGKYHIFNQKNGTNVYLGRINWGHFSSPDLVQWTEHRPVLTPEKGYDQYGIWSGHSVINDEGKPVIMYTGGDGQDFGMCLATPEDEDLIMWKKFEGNPLIQGPPKNFSRTDFRDPYIWKEGENWYMIIGFGLVENKEEKGTVLLYKSTDMKNWQYLHPLFKGNRSVDDTGIFWEMPVFWKMNGKYVLLVNPTPHYGKPAVAVYWTGDFVNEKFIPDHKMPKRLEVINRMLSPSVALDENGQTTAIAIIPDLIPAEIQMEQGWTHLYSIPRIWDLADGYIFQQPHPAMKILRTEEEIINDREIKSGENLLISRGKQQMEIITRLVPKDCEKFGFIIGKNKANGEETKIYFDLKTDELLIDLTKSSQNELVEKKIEKGYYKLNSDQEIELQLFIDGSVVEGFINGKDAFTTRIFPQYENSDEVELFSEEGTTLLKELKIWKLRNSNNKTDF